MIKFDSSLYITTRNASRHIDMQWQIMAYIHWIWTVAYELRMKLFAQQAYLDTQTINSLRVSDSHTITGMVNNGQGSASCVPVGKTPSAGPMKILTSINPSVTYFKTNSLTNHW